MPEIQTLREAVAKRVMDEVGLILVRLMCNNSGQLVESILQLLSDDLFDTLAILTIGQESDDLARGMIYDIVLRVSSKLGIEFESTDPITDAARNVLFLINCERLRRTGHMMYVAPDNIFTMNPKVPGFTQLTDMGKEVAFVQILEKTNEPKFIM